MRLPANTLEHRFSLERTGLGGMKRVAFVMLNPSTANDSKNDATLRRCISFAKREGASSLRVGNLFADRATKPRALLDLYDDASRPNEAELASLGWALEGADLVIVGWGAQTGKLGRLVHERVDAILEGWLRRIDVLQCLGFTKAREPRHPLMLPASAPLIPWAWVVNGAVKRMDRQTIDSRAQEAE